MIACVSFCYVHSKSIDIWPNKRKISGQGSGTYESILQLALVHRNIFDHCVGNAGMLHELQNNCVIAVRLLI